MCVFVCVSNLAMVDATPLFLVPRLSSIEKFCAFGELARNNFAHIHQSYQQHGMAESGTCVHLNHKRGVCSVYVCCVNMCEYECVLGECCVYVYAEDDLTTQIWVAKWLRNNTFGWPFLRIGRPFMYQ